MRPFFTEFDTDLREHYLARVQTPYKLLAEKLNAQTPADEDTLNQLFSLEKKLSNVKYKDRLTPVKKDLLLQLSHYYEKQSDYENALIWLQKLIDFVPKNIDYQYNQVELLFKSGNRKQAMEKLAGLFKLLPENNRIANRYLPEVIKDKNYRAAYEGLLTFLHLRADATRNEWGYYWSETKNYNREFSNFTSPKIEPGVINLQFSVPEKTSFIRFDAPNHSVLTIRNINVAILHNNQWQTLPNNLLHTKNIQRTKKFMRLKGKAFQIFSINNIPKKFRSNKPQQVRIKIAYLDDIDWINDMISQPEFNNFMSSLKKDARSSDITLLKKAISSALRKSLVIVDLGKNKLKVNSGFLLDPVSGKLQFNKPLNRNMYKNQLKLVLPHIISAHYKLRLEAGKKPSTRELIPVVTHSESLNYDKTNGELIITGNKPNPSLTIDFSALPADLPLTIKGDVL